MGHMRCLLTLCSTLCPSFVVPLLALNDTGNHELDTSNGPLLADVVIRNAIGGNETIQNDNEEVASQNEMNDSETLPADSDDISSDNISSPSEELLTLLMQENAFIEVGDFIMCMEAENIDIEDARMFFASLRFKELFRIKD